MFNDKHRVRIVSLFLLITVYLHFMFLEGGAKLQYHIFSSQNLRLERPSEEHIFLSWKEVVRE